jgi:serine/threonine-protein kinase
LNVRDELLSKRAKCPVCGHVFVATADDAPTTFPPESNTDKELLNPSAKKHEEFFGGGADAPESAPQTVGAFEILEPLGRGGMAAVYKARDSETGQLVAIKIGHRFLALDPTNFERFKREFTAVRELRHPHLVETLDFGEAGGLPYLVMEFVAGQSLEKRLRQGPLPLSGALAVFGQVAEGLQFLHQRQIVHRDIKPGNILLGEDGVVKLGDFGLLKNLTGDTILTQSGQAMGTMEYGAPEQFEDAKSADLRCDVYSLAAALYTALTGQFPFGMGGHMKILQRKFQSQFVPLRQLLPDVPRTLDEMVSRCLRPQRDDRPGAIAEFAAALRDAGAALEAPAESSASAGVETTAEDSADCADRRATVRVASTITAAFVPFH